LDVKATQAAATLLSVKQTVPWDKVPAFFKSQMWLAILKYRGSLATPSAKEQFVWLAKQAESFSRLGFPRRSAGLREAALLLEPGDVKERLALLADYRRMLIRGEALPQEADGETIETVTREGLARCLLCRGCRKTAAVLLYCEPHL